MEKQYDPPLGALTCFERLRQLADMKSIIYLVFPPFNRFERDIVVCDLGREFEIRKDANGTKVTLGHITYWSEDSLLAYAFGEPRGQAGYAWAFENYWMAWGYSQRAKGLANDV